LAAAFVFFAMIATMSTASAGPADKGSAAAADALHAAIAAGDEQGVRELLAPDVLIFESGGIESSREEYASHHMHADMEFLAGVERQILDRDVFEAENLAVVSTRSRLSGRFRDKEVDLFSTETLVLILTDVAWKVRHIHWSSTPAK
jgi:ketosteroid isomerase-like protein